MARLSVIVPALNEERHLAAAVAEVMAALAGRFDAWEIIVIDDGSSDRTGEIADTLAAQDERIRAIHNPRPRNLGGVYKQGVAAARYEYVVMVPGDNENPADALKAPFDAVGSADIVLPYPIDNTVRSRFRNVVSSSYTRLLNRMFGLDLPYYNGTVVHRTEYARSAALHTDSFAYQAELLVRLLAEGKSYRAVGIQIVPRPGRRSKALRPANVAGVTLSILRLALEIGPSLRRRSR